MRNAGRQPAPYPSDLVGAGGLREAEIELIHEVQQAIVASRSGYDSDDAMMRQISSLITDAEARGVCGATLVGRIDSLLVQLGYPAWSCRRREVPVPGAGGAKT
jgi:hypothetical protein